MRELKIQNKNLLNMKIIVNYLNFIFHIAVKTKSMYKTLNFVIQFIKNTKWYFRYRDFLNFHSYLEHSSIRNFFQLFSRIIFSYFQAKMYLLCSISVLFCLKCNLFCCGNFLIQLGVSIFAKIRIF